LEQVINVEIDNPASKVLKIMLQQGVESLTPKMKTDWSRFLLSLRFREEENVIDASGFFNTELHEWLVSKQNYYESMKSPEDPPTYLQFCEQHFPGIKNVGKKALVAWLCGNEDMKHISKMVWWIENVSGQSYKLLTSNRPCIYTRGYGDPQCVICLPLSPIKVFFAVNEKNIKLSINRLTKNKLVKLVNESMLIQRNIKFVYALDNLQREFIKMNLPKTI